MAEFYSATIELSDRTVVQYCSGIYSLTNNAAEWALRPIALGRKAWLFAGSDHGGDRAAFMYTLIVTAKLNDIDPQALARRCARPHR